MPRRLLWMRPEVPNGTRVVTMTARLAGGCITVRPADDLSWS